MRSSICFVMFTISIVTQIFGATVTNSFYCNTDPRIYNICRTCPDLNKDCEMSPRCQCDNIQIYNQGEKNTFCVDQYIIFQSIYPIN